MKNNIKTIEKHVEKFIKKNYKDAIVVKEYSRLNLESRPDYALFLEDRIIFIELKGNKDTFARLDRQVFYYKRLADELIVVLDKKHNKKRAIELNRKGIGIIFYKKKKLKTKFIDSKCEPFMVSDILKLLYAEELKLFLSFIEENNPNLKIKSMSDRFYLIKAIYTQIEIKELAHNIIYNRMKKWKENGCPEFYGYGKLTKMIRFKDTKTIMFFNFLEEHCTVSDNVISVNN